MTHQIRIAPPYASHFNSTATTWSRNRLFRVHIASLRRGRACKANSSPNRPLPASTPASHVETQRATSRATTLPRDRSRPKLKNFKLPLPGPGLVITIKVFLYLTAGFLPKLVAASSSSTPRRKRLFHPFVGLATHSGIYLTMTSDFSAVAGFGIRCIREHGCSTQTADPHLDHHFQNAHPRKRGVDHSRPSYRRPRLD